mmetsp:Transcript_23084/g.91562  ORF Transcript_23084/g.91562 Transcript_23084/m.91562 type:complete len:205 (-) Transcript_23084:1258-1872(-)
MPETETVPGRRAARIEPIREEYETRRRGRRRRTRRRGDKTGSETGATVVGFKRRSCYVIWCPPSSPSFCISLKMGSPFFSLQMRRQTKPEQMRKRTAPAMPTPIASEVSSDFFFFEPPPPPPLHMYEYGAPHGSVPEQSPTQKPARPDTQTALNLSTPVSEPSPLRASSSSDAVAIIEAVMGPPDDWHASWHSAKPMPPFETER